MGERHEGPHEWVEKAKEAQKVRGPLPPQQKDSERVPRAVKAAAKRALKIQPLGEAERRTVTRVVVELYQRNHGKPPDPKRVKSTCLGRENLPISEEQAAIEIAAFMIARQRVQKIKLPYGTYDRSMRQTVIADTIMAMCRREGLRAMGRKRMPAMASCEPRQADIAAGLEACGIKRRSKRTICRDLLAIAGPSMPYARKKRGGVDESPWGRAYGHLSFDEIKAMSGVFRRWRRLSTRAGSVFTATMYEFRKELFDLATDVGMWFLEQFSFFRVPPNKLKMLSRGWVPRLVQLTAGFLDNNDLVEPVLRVLKEKWQGTDRLERCLAFAKIGNDIRL